MPLSFRYHQSISPSENMMPNLKVKQSNTCLYNFYKSCLIQVYSIVHAGTEHTHTDYILPARLFQITINNRARNRNGFLTQLQHTSTPSGCTKLMVNNNQHKLIRPLNSRWLAGFRAACPTKRCVPIQNWNIAPSPTLRQNHIV